MITHAPGIMIKAFFIEMYFKSIDRAIISVNVDRVIFLDLHALSDRHIAPGTQIASKTKSAHFQGRDVLYEWVTDIPVFILGKWSFSVDPG